VIRKVKYAVKITDVAFMRKFSQKFPLFIKKFAKMQKENFYLNPNYMYKFSSEMQQT
jgi:hypothetical protein